MSAFLRFFRAGRKRFVSQRIFLLFIILLILMVVVSHVFQQAEAAAVGVRCALVVPKNANQLTLDVAERLLNPENVSFFRFEQMREDDAREAVRAESVSLAILLPPDIMQGETTKCSKDAAEGTVEFITMPGSVLSSAARDVVFNTWYQITAVDRLIVLTREKLPDLTSSEEEELKARFQDYQQRDESIFLFGDSNSEANPRAENVSKVKEAPGKLLPFRGVFCLLWLAFAFLIALDILQLTESDFFQKLTAEECMYAQAGLLLAPFIQGTILIALSMLVTDQFSFTTEDLIPFCLFSAVLYVTAFLLVRYIRRSVILAAFIPLYLLFCLLASPVIYDLAIVAPFLRPLRYLALPSWYLIWYTSGERFLIWLAVIICSIAGLSIVNQKHIPIVEMDEG